MGRNPRPKFNIPRTPVELLLQVVAFAGLVMVFFFVIQSWSALPDIIPTHFNAAGQVDSRGSKSTLLILPATITFLYLMLTILEYFPHTYNYPFRITPQNAERQYLLARLLLTWMKAELALIMAYLQWGWIQTALGRSEGLNILFLPVILIVVFGTLVIYFRQAYRARV